MNKANSFTSLYFIFRLSAVTFFVVKCHSSVSSSVAQDLQQCGNDFENYQTEAVRAFKRIFREQQACSSCPGCDKKVEKERLKTGAKLKELITALTAPETSELTALVPQANVTADVGCPVNFSCESGGQPLRLCWWEWRSLNGQRKIHILDEEVSQSGQDNSIERILYNGDGLKTGKCGLRIQSATADHFGSWNCTLLSEQGQLFTGQVSIAPGKGIRAEPNVMSDVEIVINSTEYLRQGAWPPANVTDGRNVVFSPFSLGVVLIMARYGARGRTPAQLERVLNLSDNTAVVLERNLRLFRRGVFRVLKSIQEDTSDDYNVTVANRMFAGLGLNVNDEFKNISRATVDIKVKQLDFMEDGGRTAAEAINSWVVNKTKGRINEAISSESFKHQKQVILVNAIHLEGLWGRSFDRAETRKAAFHLNSTAQTEVDMMTSVGSYAYGDLSELNAQAVALPYKGGRYSMHIYVPKTIDGLDGLLHALKNTSMDQIRANIRGPRICAKIRLTLPKFRIESWLNLVEPLKQMGAQDMFSSNLADFSGITEDENVYVSHLLQQAYIAVDEEGAENFATGVGAAPFSMADIRSVIVVKADRPFYFQVMDDRMGIVLLAGTLRDPGAFGNGGEVS